MTTQSENHIRIGTRGSKLALWQANFTANALQDLGASTEIVVIKTQGDRVQDLPFGKLEGKGFFTKEIEEALLREEVDLAVHSMKDLPTQNPEGLVITAVSERYDPADWLLIRTEKTEKKIFQVVEGGIIGTSSARRKAQMLHYRPDVDIQELRGNVPTRVQKLRDGQYDAIILAAAGLKRLEMDLGDLTLLPLNVKEFVPAPAQGVLAFQTRSEDKKTRRMVRLLHHSNVASCTNVERKVLQLMDGGCHVPLGVYCEQDVMGNFHAWAAWSEEVEAPLRRAQFSSSTTDGMAEQLFANLKAAL